MLAKPAAVTQSPVTTDPASTTLRVSIRSANHPMAMPPTARPISPAELISAMSPRLQPSLSSSGVKKAESPLTSCPMATASTTEAAPTMIQR